MVCPVSVVGVAVLAYVVDLVRPLLYTPCSLPGAELACGLMRYTCRDPIEVIQTFCNGVDYNSTVRLQIPTRHHHDWVRWGLAAVGEDEPQARQAPSFDYDALRAEEVRKVAFLAEAPPSDSAVAAVPHWHYGRLEKDAIRRETMFRVLRALAAYPVHMEVLLVVNAAVPGIPASLVTRQVVRSKPRCAPGFTRNHCLPWEAIYAMRDYARERAAAPAAAGPPSGSEGGLPFGYYLLTESDVTIPASTFDFWRRRADGLYKRGYLLEPYRVEHRLNGQRVLTECRVDTECLKYGHALRDAAAPAAAGDLLEALDPIYLRPPDPSAGSWMLTQLQFLDFLSGNCSAWETMAWSGKEGYPGEAATHAPALHVNGNPWFGSYGPWFNNNSLTHLRMPAVHHHPAGREVAAFTRRLFEVKVLECLDLDLDGAGCPVL